MKQTIELSPQPLEEVDNHSLRQEDSTVAAYPKPRRNGRQAKCKSYFKNYKATRQLSEAKARGNK